MQTMEISQRVEAVRHFNRLYTKQIGVVTEQYLDSPFSLTEARVIYELASQAQTTATALGKELDLDAGYLSRILRAFKKQGLIDKQPSQSDGRQSILRLTEKGQEAFALVDAGVSSLPRRAHSGPLALDGCVLPRQHLIGGRTEHHRQSPPKEHPERGYHN